MSNNIIGKVFKPNKTSLFWVYFVTAAIVILGGVILMPVWQNAGDWCFFRNWGIDIINIIISVCIFIYLFTFLVKKLAVKRNNVVTALIIVEFFLLFIIAIFSILEQFDIFHLNCCQIIGLVFYCRGVVEVFRAYYFQRGENGENSDRYPVWWLVISIAFITFGAYLFFVAPFDEYVILWTVIGFIYLVGLCLIVAGFRSKPPLSKEEKALKKQEKKEKAAREKQKRLEKQLALKEKEALKKEKQAQKKEKAVEKTKAKLEKVKENSK